MSGQPHAQHVAIITRTHVGAVMDPCWTLDASSARRLHYGMDDGSSEACIRTIPPPSERYLGTFLNPTLR